MEEIDTNYLESFLQDHEHSWCGTDCMQDLIDYIQSLRKSDMEAVEEMLKSKDAYAYNIPGHCTYCGAIEGSYHKANCDALHEGIENNLRDELRSKLKEYREKNNI